VEGERQEVVSPPGPSWINTAPSLESVGPARERTMFAFHLFVVEPSQHIVETYPSDWMVCWGSGPRPPSGTKSDSLVKGRRNFMNDFRDMSEEELRNG